MGQQASKKQQQSEHAARAILAYPLQKRLERFAPVRRRSDPANSLYQPAERVQSNGRRARNPKQDCVEEDTMPFRFIQ